MDIHEKIYECEKCINRPGIFSVCDEHQEEYHLLKIDELRMDIKSIEKRIEEIYQHIEFRKKLEKQCKKI